MNLNKVLNLVKVCGKCRDVARHVFTSHLATTGEGLAFDYGKGGEFNKDFHQIALIRHHLRDVFIDGGTFVQVLLSADGVDDAERVEFALFLLQG